MKKHKITCCAIFLMFVALTKVSAQTTSLTSRVLVVKNSRSPISTAIANDYMKRRGVSNVLNVSCPDGAVSQDAESINYPDYVTAIEAPIKAYLKSHAKIDFIVFTKGVPIRVFNTPGKPYGGVCSLDSRISTLGYEADPGSSIVHVTDPNYGKDYVGDAWANKFFNSEKRFSHGVFGGYLVTRLDGYTQADAIAVTTRSLEAEKNMQNGTINQGPILLDACFDFGFPNKENQPYSLLPANYKPGQKLFITSESVYGEYNSDMSVAHDYLVSKKISVLYDSTNVFVGHKSGLMGYISWGSNDTHYDPAAYNSLRFAAGALCETAVSTSARTFLPTEGGQSLIDDIIKQGVTGVKGYTDEPLLQGIASPSILFNRYTRGWTLAESYYAASHIEGWMGIVIGDPICRAYVDPTIIVSPPDSAIVLYPNPSADTVHVNIDGDHTFKIYDMEGKVLKSGKLVDKQIIIHDLGVGVYIVTISNGGKEIRRKTIRKN